MYLCGLTRWRQLDDDDGLAAPNVWAVGDITVDMALVNIAELEGRHAVERMFGRSTNRISYQNVSSIMFLDPKIAGVGLNETELAKRKMPYRVAMYSFGLVRTHQPCAFVVISYPPPLMSWDRWRRR